MGLIMNHTFTSKIDWVTVSLKDRSFERISDSGVSSVLPPDQQALDVIENVLRIPSALFVQSRALQAVYRQSYSFGNIHVDYAPRETVANTGVCITITGQGCDTFLAYSRWRSIPAMLIWLSSESQYACGFNCPRLDVALDERCGLDDKLLLDMDVICHKVSEREFVSRAKVTGTFSDKESKCLYYSRRCSKAPLGRTAYIGGMKSKLGKARIYDKAVEQEVTDKEQWTRVEFELRNGNSNDFVACLSNGMTFTQAAKSLCENRIRFVDLDRSNARDSSVCQWWTDFLLHISKEETQPVRLKKPRKTLELQRLLNWISFQVASSLRTLGDCIGYEDLFKMIRTTRQSDRQLELIRQYKLSVA